MGLSTASLFPEDTETAFAMAARHGYDGVELMVQAEPVSQDAEAIRRLTDKYELPVLSVHSPCLLITAGVWSTDPFIKLARSVDLAEDLDAATVVVHPPFVWQRRAAGVFTESIAELQSRTDVKIAVENMFPVVIAGTAVNTYRPHWDPVGQRHLWYTLDLSHTATSGSDALELAGRMAGGLAHVHLTDGSGSSRDEHLVPGRGSQPCAEVLAGLGSSGFAGHVVIEISTRNIGPTQREIDLAESLAFARRHLGGRPKA